VERDSATHARLRFRFLARHPKSQLYIDFPDFRFFRLVPERASLNGGFGRAYHLGKEDFLIPIPVDNFWEDQEGLIRDLGVGDPDLATRIATEIYHAPTGDWAVCGIDSQGIDINFKDMLFRHEFVTPVTEKSQIKLELPKSEYAVP
jgi:putative heme iron utilization protein